MTITAIRPVDGVTIIADKNSVKHPPQIWPIIEGPVPKYQPPQSEAYKESARRKGSNAIVIDYGSSAVRAGWAFDREPRLTIPPVMARYRDRKLSKSCTFIGYDAYADATTRGQQRYAFETGSSIITNWDVTEGILDYIFLKFGVDGADGGIGRPIVMTEPVANLSYSRRNLNEIIFELYSAPALAFGIDSLFAFRYNKGSSGLVVSSSHSSTHLIPVLNSKPLLSSASRLNWGGSHNIEYMLKLLKLKYPTFPTKITDYQAATLVKEHCYISQDFEREISKFLEWTGLEDRNHVIQYPFTEHIQIEKTEEELARIAERKKESGRRLQEQAAKMRLEKLKRKEDELEYYKQVLQGLANETKKEQKRILEAEDLKDENQLEKVIKDLEKSIQRSRKKDLGEVDNTEETDPTAFAILDVPDEELDEAGLKEKKHQRLMKANVEARQRAKEEKEREAARVAEEKRQDEERRENNLDSWVEERRAAREEILQKIKARDRLKADLGNRKSLASINRMKDIAALASDGPKKRRRTGNGNGDDDTFGADDADWGVYRTIATNGDVSDEEEEEDLGASLETLEQQLLQHDPNFNEADTYAAQNDWTRSLVHAFLRGSRPYDPESARENHQLHLNVERIRVPEVIFEPSIAGVDQAGIIEIAAGILTQRLNDTAQRERILKDVFLTGGNTLFRGFQDRFREELKQVLPIGAPLAMRAARDPVLDAWKGAADWASGGGEGVVKPKFVTRQEWLEKGGDYIKNDLID
ncbi:MAG: Actin- protein 5 [Cirrosporium novae-zelandiae]|nr:MAG: Actin- protein 5 [Cirrosporium novae-zelandiae]